MHATQRSSNTQRKYLAYFGGGYRLDHLYYSGGARQAFHAAFVNSSATCVVCLVDKQCSIALTTHHLLSLILVACALLSCCSPPDLKIGGDGLEMAPQSEFCIIMSGARSSVPSTALSVSCWLVHTTLLASVSACR